MCFVFFEFLKIKPFVFFLNFFRQYLHIRFGSLENVYYIESLKSIFCCQPMEEDIDLTTRFLSTLERNIHSVVHSDDRYCTFISAFLNEYMARCKHKIDCLLGIHI